MHRARPRDGIAWITGASSGIGRALSARLAAQGWHVVATARRAEALAETAVLVPGAIHALPGDVTDAGAMRALVAKVERDHGPIALAVLGAGLYDLAERERFDAARAWRTIEGNLGGTVRCLEPVLDAMLPRGRGQIALVASLAGYGGIPGSVAYGASKAAMIAMAEALRVTHARDGITIQIVNPGFVRTPMTDGNPYPMPFMASPEQAAAIIARGLSRTGFEIAFPRRLVWPMKAAGLLPYPLWLALMDRVTRRTRPSPGAPKLE